MGCQTSKQKRPQSLNFNAQKRQSEPLPAIVVFSPIKSPKKSRTVVSHNYQKSPMFSLTKIDSQEQFNLPKENDSPESNYSHKSHKISKSPRKNSRNDNFSMLKKSQSHIQNQSPSSENNNNNDQEINEQVYQKARKSQSMKVRQKRDRKYKESPQKRLVNSDEIHKQKMKNYFSPEQCIYQSCQGENASSNSKIKINQMHINKLEQYKTYQNGF